MKRRFAVTVAASVIAIVVLAAPASAGLPMVITIDDNFFAPKKASLSVSTDVLWSGDADNAHTITHDKGLFNSGTVSGGINLNGHPSAGTFPYHCKFHGSRGGRGMSGTLKVKPSTGFMKGGAARRGGDEFFVAWASKVTTTGNQFDLRFKVGKKGDWKTWKKNVNERSDDFGEGNTPVNVKPGKTYFVQARSELESNPKKRSDWSPSLKLEAQA